MKKRLKQGISLFIAGTSFLLLFGCNSGAENKTDDETDLNQDDFKEQIEGVYEYLSPNQGHGLVYDNSFIFVFGNSDTTMVFQSGTYTTTRDTAIFTTQFASDPELVGTSIKWSARFMDNDSVKVMIFDKKGNVISEFFNIKKAKVEGVTNNKSDE